MDNTIDLNFNPDPCINRDDVPFYGQIETENLPSSFRLQRSLTSKGTWPAPTYISNVVAYLRIVLRESRAARELAVLPEDLKALKTLSLLSQDILEEFEERYRLP